MDVEAGCRYCPVGGSDGENCRDVSEDGVRVAYGSDSTVSLSN